jgi:S-methylmethionine-dependent homocysteine/selenocysteine methylase
VYQPESTIHTLRAKAIDPPARRRIMTTHIDPLPHQSDRVFLTDGGIETCLLFLEGLELRDFAAFELLTDPAGREKLKSYYRRYADIARDAGTGFIFESATWRASQDWADHLGYSPDEMDRINRDAITLMRELAAEYGSSLTSVLSGCVGPRGDGYNPAFRMSTAEAEAYHAAQIASFAAAGAGLITAITMTCADEAIGIARAAAIAGIPAVISFTVETDGRLPSGQTIAEAIEAVDAACEAPPAYYMINCAHPSHFEGVLDRESGWVSRICGVRANASRKSHAELDNAVELDAGNPRELGQNYRELRRLMPNLVVMGGCCGTDHRHIEAIRHACAA